MRMSLVRNQEGRKPSPTLRCPCTERRPVAIGQMGESDRRVGGLKSHVIRLIRSVASAASSDKWLTEVVHRPG